MLAQIQREEKNQKGLDATLEKIITIDSETSLAKKAKELQKSP